MPDIGDKIDVYSPLGDEYCARTVAAVDDDGKHYIKYDDGSSENLNMREEI